jgi:transcription initiation factor TFIIF subunit beta
MDRTVEYRCEMEPTYGEEYRRILKNRTAKSNIKTRQTQQIEEKDIVENRPTFIARERREKYTRMEKNELIDVLFSLFEQSTYYDLKTLAMTTKQPTVWLTISYYNDIIFIFFI